MTQPLTQVAEERALGKMCGHGACDRPLDAPKPKGTFKLDSKRQRVSACELAAHRLAARLGPPEAALERFGVTQATLSGTGILRATASDPDQAESMYAAGSDDNPIMLSQVRERDPAELAAQADRDAELALQTLAALHAGANPSAVEGYVPRGKSVPSHHIPTVIPPTPAAAAAASSAAPSMPVISEEPLEHAGTNGRTAAASAPANGRSMAAQQSDAASEPAEKSASAAAGTASAADGGCSSRDIQAGSGSDRSGSIGASESGGTVPERETAVDSAAAESESADVSALDSLPEDAAAASLPQQPVLVFEVEDADGPLEGAAQENIAARFGRLKVADAGSAQQALAAEPTGVEADLNLWRQHLGIAAAEGSIAGGSAMLHPPTAPVGASITAAAEPDSKANVEDGVDTNDPEAEGDFLSQFGRLFTTLDGWVTDATLRFVRCPPGRSPGQPEDTPPPEFAQGRAVLEGVLAREVPGVLGALHVPSLRSAVEVALRQLVATFYLRSAVPSLKEREWRLLMLALLRALSIERLPALQARHPEQFDGRAGVRTLNDMLADAGSTIEEFDALLEVMLPAP
ncbi:hypothetical protein COCSUDRAFT_55793 [Coccomyxa subellipsoidea C-169]|uniref:Uncharacterized protein n=1 Tax=Coccomyxa subellipsoidea (strain C-169) TaxID=574566 RepID=I0ZAZ4_COCSC|nr:hypothetical protein COCSUDRAFT_55793 [Coccomyxa subellipsoidea C-169]EIE27813.1 hypothetical protein COCSUDRAFT_55793 [Coccomyxa subellipsoidea C-169]|eukprot:XP_005652357.1 hypothetical protein COCSUDRAFT_55793 [Coccomyxa subellipsoidea C-169]